MKVLQTLHEMMQNNPSIEESIIGDIDWTSSEVPQEDMTKWDKFHNTGLLKESSFPAFKKASELALGVKFPIRAMRKIDTKHGLSMLVQSDDFSMLLPHRFRDLPIPENVDGRFFMIVGFKKCKNGRETPMIRFD